MSRETNREVLVCWAIEYKFEDGSWRLENDILASTRKRVVEAWEKRFGWTPGKRGANARPVRVTLRRFRHENP